MPGIEGAVVALEFFRLVFGVLRVLEASEVLWLFGGEIGCCDAPSSGAPKIEGRLGLSSPSLGNPEKLMLLRVSGLTKVLGLP